MRSADAWGTDGEGRLLPHARPRDALSLDASCAAGLTLHVLTRPCTCCGKGQCAANVTESCGRRGARHRQMRSESSARCLAGVCLRGGRQQPIRSGAA